MRKSEIKYILNKKIDDHYIYPISNYGLQLNFYVVTYSKTLLIGLYKYFNLAFKKIHENEINKVVKFDYDFHILKNISKYYKRTEYNDNVESFVQNNINKDYTNEMIIEFLIRYADPGKSISDEEVKELLEHYSKTFTDIENPNIENFTKENSPDFAYYCVPIYIRFNNIVYLITELQDKDLIIFTTKNLYNLYKCYSKSQNREQNYLFKDYDVSILTDVSYLGWYNNTIPQFLLNDNIVKELEESSAITAYNFSECVWNLDLTEELMLETLKDVNTEVFSKKIYVSDEDKKIIENVCKTLEAEYGYHSTLEHYSHLNLSTLSGLEDKFLINYIIEHKDNFNIKEYYDLEVSIVNSFEDLMNTSDFWFYYFSKRFSNDEIVKLIIDVYNSGFMLSLEQWFEYVNNKEEYDKLPVAWWAGLLQ